MTKLIRKYPTYELNNLPKLKFKAFEYVNRIGLKNMGYSGSVIFRSVPNTINVFKHYGIIYGFDENETFWIIENNLNGVECVTLHDFLNGQEVYGIKPNYLDIDIILERAKQKSFKLYNARYNNCEHFVNYCITGISSSEQSENTVSFANVLFSVIEIYAIIRNPILLDSFTQIRETINIKRIPEIQTSLEKQANPTKKQN